MRNHEEARAIADRVDDFASEDCNVAEISAFLDVEPSVVRSAMWIGPSRRAFRTARRLDPSQSRSKHQ